MRRSKGRAFIGFLLTCFLAITLISTCLMVCLKVSVLKGGNVKEFIKSLDINKVVHEVVSDSINKSNDEQKVSGDLVDKLLTEDVINDVTDVMVDAITEDKYINLSDVKDSCMDAVATMSEQAIDDILNDLKNTTNVIDVDTLKNNSVIQQYQADFNIDITTPIIEHMQNVYGTKSVSLEEIDLEEVKSEANEALKENVLPEIEKKVDNLITETNAEVNEQLNEFKQESNFNTIIKTADMVLAMITKAVIIGAVVVVVFIALQFVVYKKDVNKAFKNVGIAGIILSVIMFALYMLLDFIMKIIRDLFNSDEVLDETIYNIANKYIPKTGSVASTIAIVAIAISIVCIVLAVVIKKKCSQSGELYATEDTFADSKKEITETPENIEL